MKRAVPLWIGTTCLLSILLSAALAAEVLPLGLFSSAAPSADMPAGWEAWTFPKIDRHTHYSLVKDNDRTVVLAESHASASGLIRRVRIDPLHHPWLRWHWKIQNALRRGDVTQKTGDDYPARVYVAFAFDPDTAGMWQRLQHQAARLASGTELPGTALTYIWDNRAPRGTVVDNPYTARVKMIVLQSGDLLAGQWVEERRNIVDDYRLAFGRNPPQIIGVALMTDTDNTSEEATAYYGDIVLEGDGP